MKISVFNPIKCNPEQLSEVISRSIVFSDKVFLDYKKWEDSRYYPTPTIIEAAMSLYNGHDVKAISRKDASAKNLKETTHALTNIIKSLKHQTKRVFVLLQVFLAQARLSWG